MRRLLLVPVCLAAASSAQADDTSMEFGRANETRTGFAYARAICEVTPAPGVPTIRPPVASCPAVDLFYGFDRPADPVAARACALQHLATKPAYPPGKAFYVYEPFQGAMMLSSIYANGLGVPRDLDMAIGFACRANILDLSAPDIATIVDALDARRDNARDRAIPFDICTTAVHDTLKTSCIFLASRQRRERQHRRLDALSKPFDTKTRQALNAALKAFEDFEARRSAHEMPPKLSRDTAITTPSETDRLLVHFTDTVETLSTNGIPAANAVDVAREVAALTRAFESATRLPHQKDVWQIAARKDLRADQAAWSKFRKAFLGFARRLKPGTSPTGLGLALIEERLAQVEQIGRDDLVARPLSTRSRSTE